MARRRLSAADQLKKLTAGAEREYWEDMLWLHLRALGQQDRWIRQHPFHPSRAWRFDFARPDMMLAVEIEGVIRGKPGRHQRVDGATADAEKYAEAMCLGWRVLRVMPSQVRTGQARDWIEQLTADD